MSEAPREIPPDVHLLAALRHAPDREVVPPLGVSAQILSRAQQAVRSARAEPWYRRGWARLRALDPLRPPLALAGALATLALATVIGVMWQGGPPEDPEPDLAEATVPATAPAAPAAVPPQTPATEAARVAAPARASRPASSSVPAPAPARPLPAAKVGAPILRSQAPGAAAAPHATQRRAVAPANAPVPDNAAPTVAPLSGAGPQPLASLLDAAREKPAAVRVVPALRATARAEGKMAVPRAAATADSVRERAVTESSPPASVALSDIATSRDWLARLAVAAQGHWQLLAEPVAEAGGEAHTVWLEGAPAGRLVLTDSAVLWLPAASTGQVWRADLDVLTLQALRAQAPRP